ncbi:hypothetical protein SAMN05421839_11246 [Halolactibacillus halophilus]|uniref:Thioredoxin-like fold domain-containing protein n=2 Tax=Halolactibacillus halophilus TaxID=306540 RepID=A0A1I5P339_9BACI|nr:hypothetical protein HHA03_10500 [Halolactibacillus halophilus]SFP28270.1 hypothetical protein SAMN05421839_11246 [Halolactibacillus halophilus]
MKSKRWVLLLSGVIMIFLISIYIFNTNKTTHEFITAPNVFNQDGEYFVYFWQEDCGYCQEIEANISDYEDSGLIPLYVVDMTKAANLEIWYDWEAHHEANDVMIGYIEAGEEVYEKEPDLYLNHPEIQYDIIINDDQIIAQHQTAFFNPSPTDLTSLDIMTTPALLYVSDTTQLVVGVEETLALLEQYK